MSPYNYRSKLDVKYVVSALDDVLLTVSPMSAIIHRMAAGAMLPDLEEGGSSISLRDVERNGYDVIVNR